MRDCMNCVNHTKDGCKVWNCKFTTVEDAKTEFAVEVLEKVKDAIMNHVCSGVSCDDCNFDLGSNCGIAEVFDHYISELKGETE